jgi:hypothetical protein
MTRFVGWDIGGAHLKAGLLETGGGPARLHTTIVPFEVWKDPGTLAARLRDLPGSTGNTCAVTMTAELSDLFPDRAAGVRAVIEACALARGSAPFRVLDLDGRLIDPREAVGEPARVAAANWVATARVAAAVAAAGVVIDMGSTTTDLIPFAGGAPRPRGRTDRARLATGELVYTGLLRTPPAAIAGSLPVGGGWCRVAPEQFAITADVHRILGIIDEEDYTPPTPDGRGRDAESCAARLARVVCADRRELGPPAIRALAAYLRDRQIDLIARALHQVLSTPELAGVRDAIPCGIGASLASAAAARCNLRGARLAERLTGIVGDGGPPAGAGPGPGGPDRRRPRAWDEAAPSGCLAILQAVEAGVLRFPDPGCGGDPAVGGAPGAAARR